MKKFKPISRRDFIKAGGATGILAHFPLLSLMNAMVSGFIDKAHASDKNNKNYVHFNAPGGPSRWVFDLFLQPNGESDPFVPLKSCGSYMDVNNNNALIYKTIPAPNSNFHIPWLWQFNVPAPNGGTRPMTKLLENMLSIRGIRLNGDGHPNNIKLQVQPVLLGPSLTGLSADASQAIFPSVSLGGDEIRYAYKAPKGAANIVLPQSSDINPISFLTESFKKPAQELFRNNNTLSSLVELALESLSFNAKENNVSTQFLSSSRKSAEAIFRMEISTFINEYNALFNKYNDLTIRALRETGIDGLNLHSIPTSDHVKFNYAFNNVYDRISHTRLSGDNSQNKNLDGLMANARCDMARIMAVAEFLLKKGLSSTVFGGLPEVGGINVNGKSLGFRHDSHGCGSILVHIVHSMWSRAVAANMIEFIEQLKASHIFDKTVIHFCGEMGRVPEESETGSEHGWEAHNVSIWSGMVPKLMVLGNIHTKHTSYFGKNAPGTWGCSAVVEDLGAGEKINIHHVNTTIATMLEVAPPSRIGSSLVALVNGEVVKTIHGNSGPKNIPN